MADETIPISIHHHGKSHPLTPPAQSTLADLATTLFETFHIPVENMKLLISPKPGMMKAPFPDTSLTDLPLTNPKFKVTLLGTPASEIENLNTAGAEMKRRVENREAARREARMQSRSTSNRSGSGAGGVRTLSDSNANYTFHTLKPLPYLPNPSKSHAFLKRLSNDPGIKTAMANHKFSVGLLTEMDPILHTTSESRTLGLNRNKGEVIELRLRTDAYDGYRDYRTIRKTLCHELAHCVFSEHDRDFWDLTGQIEKEVERADWKSGGRQAGGDAEFYNPGDWESERDKEHFDEGGLVGSSQVLGSGNVGGAGGGVGMRETIARAAEERARKAREERGDPSS